jgi:hypothetical protein
MKQKIKKILKKTFLYDIYGSIKSEFRKQKAEYILVSFPKCGRTWVRYILGHYFSIKYNIDFSIHPHKLHKQKKQIPLVIINHFWSKDKGKTKIEKLKKYKDKKIIFLTRNPADVVVSYFFEITKREPEFRNGKIRAPKKISEFVKNKKVGVPAIVRYMNKIYLKKDIFENFHIIQYENIHKKGIEEILQLLSFLEDKPDKDIIEKALEKSEFKKMRKVEKKELIDNDKLKPADKEDPESFKVRKGKVGGYKEYLDQETINYVENFIKEKLNKKLFNLLNLDL